jgi:hypothetical protein
MTQSIDPIKVKAATEYLEWVLNQCPDEPAVQGMLRDLLPQDHDLNLAR